MLQKYQIQCDNRTIGLSALEERDEGMGVLSGTFEPTKGYEEVRDVFLLFSNAQSETGPVDEHLLAKYYKRRDELELRVIDLEGVALPVSVVHIADFSEIGEDCYEVEVHISNAKWFTKEP